MHSLDGRVATTSMQKGQCITLYLYFQSTLFSLYSCNLLQHILDRTFALCISFSVEFLGGIDSCALECDVVVHYMSFV